MAQSPIGAAMTASPPSTCQLPSVDYRERLRAFAALDAEFLIAREHEATQVIARYRPDAASRLRDLIDAERRCCPRLRFTLRERPDAIELRIEAPNDVDAASALAPFSESADEGSPVSCATQGCGCATNESPPLAMAVPPRWTSNRLPWLGATSVAIACAACCALPLGVTALGLSGATVVAVIAAQADTFLVILAGVALALGAWAWWRRRARRRVASTG
jgi:hypothetical protein